MKRLNKLVLAAAALTAALALAGCDNGSPSSSGGGGSSYDPWPSRVDAMQKEVAEMRGTQATEQNSTPMSMAKKALNIAKDANNWMNKGAGAENEFQFETLANNAAQIAYNEAIADDVFKYDAANGKIQNTDVTNALGANSPEQTEIEGLLAFANKVVNPTDDDQSPSQSNMTMLRNVILTDEELAGLSPTEKALKAIEAIIKALELTKKDINSDAIDSTLSALGLSVAKIGDNNPFTPIDDNDLTSTTDNNSKKNPKISKGYTYLFDKTKNYLVLEAKDLKAHVNGAGNVGYWLGFNFDDKKYEGYTVGWGYGATVKGTTPLASTTCYFDYDTVSKRDEKREAPDSKPCVYFVADDGMGTTKQLVVSFDVTKEEKEKTVTDSGIEKATLADNNDLPGAKIADVGTLNAPTLSYNYKDPTTYYIKLTATNLKGHINGEGTPGHWVGVKIPVGQWLNKDTDTIEIDGKPYPVQSNLDADGQNFSIYWDAKKYSEGKTAEFKIKTKKPYQLGNPIDKTFTFVVDMSNVTLDDTQDDISSIPFETAKLGDNNQFNKNDKLHDNGTYELKQMSFWYKDPTIYTITLRADNLKKHKNANQVNGYWVGIKIPADNKWLNKDTDTIVIDGKPYTMAEALDADGTGVSIYWDYDKKKPTGDAYFIVKRGANAKPKEYRVNVDFEVKKADAKIEIGSDENGIKTKTGIEKATIADKNPVTPIDKPVGSDYKLSEMYYNDDDPTEYFVKLTAKDLKAHVNGAGTVGYWVGIALDNAKDVWKLLPNDKLEYGIKGETPKTINSVSGNSNIYWDVAKVLGVTGDTKPTAYFEVTRGGKKLYRLNVELNVAKATPDETEKKLTDTDSEKANFKTATLGDWGGSASDDNKLTTVHKGDATYTVSEIKYDYANPKQYNVKLEIDSLRRHFNSEHNPGYWVGVDLTGKWAANGDTLVSVNGVARNKTIDNSGLQFYWDAGKTPNPTTIKIRKAEKNAFGISNYEYDVVVTVVLKGGNNSNTLQHPAITDFATAPLVDQAGYFKTGLYTDDSYKVTYAGYIDNDPTKYLVNLEVKDLVSHTNGAKQKGWWVGIKLPKEWISKGDSFGKADGEKTNIALDRKVTELDTVDGKECFTVYWNLLNTEKAGDKGTFVFQHQGKRYTIIVDFSGCTRK